MIKKRHLLFNISMIAIPWLTLLFFDKREFKRYSVAGIFIVIFDTQSLVWSQAELVEVFRQAQVIF
ncbi:hypothetical protein [Neobacillus mesonae]|uniref:hypothetical protein n=1 Tax=Neobacillus mesonae TaxID=1193713 RepID=UPI0026B0C45E